MNTPSHLLMTAALDRALPRVPIVRQAFLLGAIAPDIPLWLLSLGGIVFYHLMLGMSPAETARLMFDQLFFHHPLWIISHNTLHSPLLLLCGLALLWHKRRYIGSPQRWGFWFLLACLLHAGVDILTHHSDGPLLLFPLNWSLRFQSPVSYWEDPYYAREFGYFELGLNGFCLLYLLSKPVYRRFLRTR